MASSSSPLSSLGTCTPNVSAPCSPSLASSSDLSSAPASPASPSLPYSLALSQTVHERYPSPVSTSLSSSGINSPIKLGQPLGDIDLPNKRSPSTIISAGDGSPPAKRRKTMTPKERTTDYVDLMKPEDDMTSEDKRQMDRLAKVLRTKKKIVVIAGAGISVSAGIPDFRSSTGLFATVKSQHKLKASGKQLFDASVYKHDSSTESFHSMVRSMDTMSKAASPTPFHHLLASLAQEGRLLRLYSQNIDCLDTSLKPLATNVPLNVKGPWPATIQLHGSLEKMVCTKCGHIAPFKNELFDGPEAPLCKSCMETDQVRTAHAGKRSHGIGRLRPRFVLYNEYNPDEEAIGSVSSADLKARPDAVIVVGTTLKVPGTRRLVKELCQVARGRRNGFTAWINIDAAPKGVDFKDCWDLVVRSKCDDVARMVALPPWDCHIGDDYLVSKEHDVELAENRNKSTLEVNIRSHESEEISEMLERQATTTPKAKKVEEIQGILTPRPSPKILAVRESSKTKQAKLSFGGDALLSKDAKDKKVVAASKGSKPRGRKVKAQSKVSATNTTLDGFKASKKTDDAGITGKKLGKGISAPPPSDLPKVEFAKAPEALPPLRPTEPDLGQGAITGGHGHGGDSTVLPKQEILVTDIKTPETPTTHRPPSRDTVSPTSAPRGMARLIDMSG